MPDPPRPNPSSAHSVPPPMGHVPRRAAPAGPPSGPLYPRSGSPSLHVLCGGIAAAWGAALMVSKLFDVGGWDYHGNAAYEFGKDVGLFGGAALFAAGVFHVQRGIRRYKGLAVGDVTTRERIRNLSIAILVFLTVVLVAPAVPDADNRFADDRAPYSYKYPGDWALGEAQAILNTFPWMREVSQVGRGDNNAGVSVSTAAPGDAREPVDNFAALITQQGGSIVARTSVTVAGLPGVTMHYDMPAARHDGSLTVLDEPRRRFLVWCQWESDPASAKEACAKVKGTLSIK